LKFGLKLWKGAAKEEREETFWDEAELVGVLETQKWSVPEGYIEIEYYPLKPPFSYAA